MQRYENMFRDGFDLVEVIEVAFLDMEEAYKIGDTVLGPVLESYITDLNEGLVSLEEEP